MLTFNFSQLDPAEYAGCMWIEPHKILNGYHPTLQRAVLDYLAMLEWIQLEELLKTNQSKDAEIVKKLRKFVDLKNESIQED